MKISSGSYTASFLLRDLLREIILLPIWWYTIGFKTVLVGSLHNIQGVVRNFGLDVWLKNLFVPMYGETSISGKLISFFIRFMMVIFQTIGVFVWGVLLLALNLVYLIAFPLSLLGILYYGFGMLFF